MNQIMTLSKIFARYRAYPISKYIPQSPVRCFQRLYPKNHFSSQVEAFLREHIYNPAQRGADLPWWGSKYFTDEIGRRVMVISQDSLADDAESIVFWACLYPVVSSKDEYIKFTQGLDNKNLFAFNRWETMRKQLLDWKIDLRLCYITDASKVYKDDSRKSFDKPKSKELLKAEIEFCNPDLVILLGKSPLLLMDFPQLSHINPTKKYAYAVEAGKLLWFENKKYVIAPFPIGQGRTQPNFKRRLEIASSLIKNG
ncbi:MAG: hypothetical protein Q8N61_02690 [bacterium]|nr:hypothetical protein [bacterium]